MDHLLLIDFSAALYNSFDLTVTTLTIRYPVCRCLQVVSNCGDSDSGVGEIHVHEILMQRQGSASLLLLVKCLPQEVIFACAFISLELPKLATTGSLLYRP